MSEFRTLSYVAAELPFVPEQDSFIYLAPDGYRDLLLEERLTDIKRGYSTYGYKLVYLPEVIGKITRKIISYNIPNYSGPMLNWQDVRDRFVSSLSLSLDAPALVLFSDAGARLVPLDVTTEYKSPVEAFLDQSSLFAVDKSYIEIKPSYNQKESGKVYAKKKLSHSKLGINWGKIFDETIGGLYDGLDAGQPEESSHDNTPRFRVVTQKQESAAVDEEELNELECDRRIVVNLSDLVNVGLTREQIRQLLNMKRQLSTLHITRSGRIFLEDYDHKEIILDDLSTAIYLLFLQHEEGINLKDLGDHYLELLDYYLSVSGRDDKAAMERTIRDLVVPGNNSVNALLSRIKRAFIDSFDVELAENYFIKGKKGEAKFVSLDRSLVIWDAIRPPYNR